MKMIMCFSAAILLVGCNQSVPVAAKAKPVAVGMVYDDAEPATCRNWATAPSTST